MLGHELTTTRTGDRRQAFELAAEARRTRKSLRAARRAARHSARRATAPVPTVVAPTTTVPATTVPATGVAGSAPPAAAVAPHRELVTAQSHR